MKKSELKNGMVIKYRNINNYSKYALVVNNLFIGLGGFMLINDYDEDLTYNLTYKGYEDFDIAAVYKVDSSGCSLLDILNGKCLIPLWDRKEQPKLTKEDKAFLENIVEENFYIARDDDNDLYLYFLKPYKEENEWFPVQDDNLNINKNLFAFIKWEDEKPYSKEDLMKLGE